MMIYNKRMIICNKMKYHKKKFLVLFLMIFLSVCIFLINPAFSQDIIDFGLIGHWSNDYGVFQDVEILDSNVFPYASEKILYYAFCATSKGMAVFSIDKEENSSKIQSMRLSLKSFIPIDNCNDIAIGKGDNNNFYAYLAVGHKGLYVIEIVNPESLYYMANIEIFGWACEVVISQDGRYAFVANGGAGLQVIDISDPTRPFIAGSCYSLDYAYGVILTHEGHYALVSAGDSLEVIDISDPTCPFIAGSCDTPGEAMAVTISQDGCYALVADYDSGLQVINISNLTDPFINGGCDTPGAALSVAISQDGRYALVADNSNGLQVIDLTDFTNPFIARSCDIPGKAYRVALSPDGDYALVADFNSNLYVIDLNDPLSSFIVGRNYDTPGDACSVAFSHDGRYALVADRDSGLQVIDISNLTAPFIAGSCDTPGTAYGVVLSIDGRYALVADGYSGLQVIDISNPTSPFIAGSCDTPGTAYGVALSIDGRYALVADYFSDLQVIDISNPTAPFIAGSCATPAWAYKVAISPDGHYALLAAVNIEVIDISNPTVPFIAGRCYTPGCATGVTISPDGHYALVADGDSGLQVIDISDPTSPFIAGSCDTPSYTREVAISRDGRYAPVADGDSGLQVIDISDPTSPFIAGSCDTPGYAQGVALSPDERYTLVAGSSSGLQVIAMRDPPSLFIAGNCDTSSCARDVVISQDGHYALVTDLFDGLKLIDISDPTSPFIAGSCDTPGWAWEVVLSPDEHYALVADGDSGLQLIDISDPTSPFIAGSCNAPDYASGVALSQDGHYALVADIFGVLQLIDISDPTSPFIAGRCDTPGCAKAVALSQDGHYALVADDSGLQVIDISDPAFPFITGHCDTLGSASGAKKIAISPDGRYALVADDSGLQVMDISNPTTPFIPDSCYIPGCVFGVTISPDGHYALVADDSGLQVIDISDPTSPFIVLSYEIQGGAWEVALSPDGCYAFVSDIGDNTLLQFKINYITSPKGNLILVAGGHRGYQNSYCQATQAIANKVFDTFINQDYGVYDIYYFNPAFIQDTDRDGLPNQMAIDDFDPSVRKLEDIIKQFPDDHMTTNLGPLYISLMGHGAEDRFQIIPHEIITAKGLKEYIDMFQIGYTDIGGTYHPGTNRQVVVIIESAASGTFLDDLKGDNITIITSTGEGASYIKPDYHPNASFPYRSFIRAFFDPNINPFINVNPSSNHPAAINNYLKNAFRYARNILFEWAKEGMPFCDQLPQMLLPGNRFTSLSFSEDAKTPLAEDFIFLDQNRSITLALIGKYSNDGYTPKFLPSFTLFSSNADILDPNQSGDIEKFIDSNNIPWYTLHAKKNGVVSLSAYAYNDPNFLLSAKLTIEVAVDDPIFSRDKDKMAIIAAGYKGTSDYLFDSTNTIANHAYKTFRAMGYSKDAIYYYNPYFLQDLDNDLEYNDITGYPHTDILDTGSLMHPDHYPFERVARIGATDLFIFMVDHGDKDTFRINPTETFHAYSLIQKIAGIAPKIDDRIVLLYDACHSGSFLESINNYPDPNLSEKLITITSTDPNQTAYFLSNGFVSFSYPFLDEWFLTHSLTDAFHYADRLLLRGQTPLISDPNLAEQWDKETVYYTDECRPDIDNVHAYRSGGNLHIDAEVYALTGIKEVWAIVESAQRPVTTTSGRAVTDAPELYLYLDTNTPQAHDSPYGGRYILPPTPDPCPNEKNYIISIYAKDNSRTRPRIASYKTALGDMTENKTVALIIASDPNILRDPNISGDLNISYQDLRQELSDRIDRARNILISKGLGQEEIFPVKSKAELYSVYNAGGTFPLAQDQTLFIYITGYTQLQNNIPYFYLNPDEGIYPQEFLSILQDADIPPDPNQRLLILMDTPYAEGFLNAVMEPDNWPERWAGIASTYKGNLFFPIDERPFPCFSGFFFSGVLSGATVAQAYRMAEMAVSLTRQGPRLFLPENFQDYSTINRRLSYYLGTCVVHGEEESLFTHCSARAEDINEHTYYQLSLTPNPDADIRHAWAVLTSPTSSIYEDSVIVDLYTNGPLYTADEGFGTRYYKAFFMIEGQIKGDAGKNRIEWQEVPIAASGLITDIKNDPFEPDNDPNFILLHAKNEIIVNTPPRRHRFHNEYTDWAYFYALKDHIYEIYTQDLSQKDYFIRISLYDAHMTYHATGKNFLAFICEESGYYLLEVTLGSTYPHGGVVEYILAVIDPQAQSYTSFLVQVINPRQEAANLLRSPIVVICEDSVTGEIYPFNNEQFIYPDSFCYKLNSFSMGKNLSIKVYQGDDPHNPNPDNLIYDSNDIETGVEAQLDIDLKDLIDPYKIVIPDTYWEDANNYRYLISLPDYPWDANNPLPFGDMDPNFSPHGDFDGDGLSNHDEIIFSKSSAIHPTIPLYLEPGMNPFYFPSVIDYPNINTWENYIYDPNNDSGSIFEDTNRYEISCYYYDTDYDTSTNDHDKNGNDRGSGQWRRKQDRNKKDINLLTPNQFNAIHTIKGGILYLDLKSLDHPVLRLKGFMNTNRFKNTDPVSWLDTEMIDPYDLDTNVRTSEILKDPNLWEIESISAKHIEKHLKRGIETGYWNTGYRFFGRPNVSGRFSEKDMCLMPYRSYMVYRNKERMQ